MTVDEQLVPFRGRCALRQNLPSKPAKYGLEIWLNCDGDASYPLKGEVYLGWQPGEDLRLGLGTEVVTNTSEPWLRSGRNVVCSHPCHWLRNLDTAYYNSWNTAKEQSRYNTRNATS